METLDWCGYREKISKICLFVLTWSTNVTDTHTDRQTHTHTQTPHDGIGRAYALHHAAKADRNRTGIKKSILHIPSFSRKFSCSWEFSTRVQHNVELVKATHDQPTNLPTTLSSTSVTISARIDSNTQWKINTCYTTNKKLSCIEYFAKSLEGHSMSFEMTPLSRACVHPY